MKQTQDQIQELKQAFNKDLMSKKTNLNVEKLIIIGILILCCFSILLVVFSYQFQIQNPKKQLTFIEKIWNQVLKDDAFKQIRDTSFIKGIAYGNLNPYCWARYLVQQVYFQNLDVKIWHQACEMGKNDSSFYEYCKIQQTGIRQQNNYLQQSINLQNAEPLEPVREYAKDIQLYLSNKSYHHIMIANYACYKVYASVLSQIYQTAKMIKSPYFPWIKQWVISSDYWMVNLQAKINYYQSVFDRQQLIQAITLFTHHQKEFFKASCPDSMS